MNYAEALKLFKLNDGYTEKELTKRYHSLALKCHPDVNPSPDAAEQFRKINDANEILKKALKSQEKPQNINHKANSIIDKQKSINKIKLLWISPTEIHNYPVYLRSYLSHINSIIENYIKNTQKLYFNYQEYYKVSLNNILTFYHLIKDCYFLNNCINEKEITEELNYHCNFAKFYQQLTDFQQKYSKLPLIPKLLDEEIANIKLYSGYENLAAVVNYYRNVYCTAATINKYYCNEKIIVACFNQDINNVFRDYFKMLKKLHNIIDYIDQNKDNVKLKMRIDLIYRLILNLNITTQKNLIFQNNEDFLKTKKTVDKCFQLMEDTKKFDKHSHLVSQTIPAKEILFSMMQTPKTNYPKRHLVRK